MNSCLLCQSPIESVLDLGSQALANGLLVSKDEHSPTYPLCLARCEKCSHLQLTERINPEILFSHYLWVTGTSKAAQDFSNTLYDEISSKQTFSNVLEIASNDGTFLKPFKENGHKVLGVDPANNLCKLANEIGINTRCGFFNQEFAKGLLREQQMLFDVVIARNVIAHTPDPIDLLKAIYLMLSDKGYAYIEFHDAFHILNTLQYDSIYHEHYSYFHLDSFSYASLQADLFPVDIIISNISGGALIVVLSKNPQHPKSKKLIDKSKEDKKNGVSTLKEWKTFSNDVHSHSHKLATMINSLDEINPIYAYGSSARSNTLLSFCDIDHSKIQSVIDNNPLKQGRFTPGTRIPIESITTLPKKNVNLLLLAWNFSDEIIAQLSNSNYQGFNIIQPLPSSPRLFKLTLNLF